MNSTTKRLYRSTTDRKIWGVCGGLGEYFGTDPVLMRVVFVVLVFATGLGILLYIILALVTPTGTSPPKPTGTSGGSGGASGQPDSQSTSGPAGESGATMSQPPVQTSAARHPMSGATLVGVILVIVGIIVLLANLNLFWWFKFSIIGPLILIVLGLLFFIGRGRS